MPNPPTYGDLQDSINAESSYIAHNGPIDVSTDDGAAAWGVWLLAFQEGAKSRDAEVQALRDASRKSSERRLRDATRRRCPCQESGHDYLPNPGPRPGPNPTLSGGNELIHARKDYNRTQDPAVLDPTLLGEGSTPIGEDEPVMLFRAKDKHFPFVLAVYEILLTADPNVSDEMIGAVRTQIRRAREWQASNGAKSPDMPEGA